MASAIATRTFLGHRLIQSSFSFTRKPRLLTSLFNVSPFFSPEKFYCGFVQDVRNFCGVWCVWSNMWFFSYNWICDCKYVLAFRVSLFYWSVYATSRAFFTEFKSFILRSGVLHLSGFLWWRGFHKLSHSSVKIEKFQILNVLKF